MVNYILALILLIIGTIMVANGHLEWAIWIGIIAIWSMGNYIASKIDAMEKKIDSKDNKL